MMKKRILIILLVIGVIFLLVAGLGQIPASRGYCVEGSFSEAPADDDAFENWLRSPPGVVEHTVHVVRTSTTPPKLRVVLIMVQNCWFKPHFPDVETAAHDLGYTLDSTGFMVQRTSD
jgi:hypothetical protein